MDQLTREVRTLRRVTYTAFGLCTILLLTALRRGTPTRFEELDVERINVIEANGALRMVISNKARSPGPLHRGKPFAYAGGTRPGMIFYSEEQTEVGGLVFDARRDANGRYGAGAGLTFDQYEQDQAVALQYQDDNGRRYAGLTVADYATGRSSEQNSREWKDAERIADTAVRIRTLDSLDKFFAKTRVYVGRQRNAASAVVLYDALGHARLRMQVDSSGSARIEFLNDSGRVVRRIAATDP